LKNVSLKKWENTAQPLILRGVHQFMDNQRAIAPLIGPDENTVVQSKARWRGSDEIDRSRRRFQHRMDGNRNGINPQQTNTFGIPNPDCLSIGELGVRKRNAFAQDTSLLLDRPLCG